MHTEHLLQTMLVEPEAAMQCRLSLALVQTGRVKLGIVARGRRAARAALLNGVPTIDLLVLGLASGQEDVATQVRELIAQAMPTRTLLLMNGKDSALAHDCRALGVEQVFERASEVSELVRYVNHLQHVRRARHRLTRPGRPLPRLRLWRERVLSWRNQAVKANHRGHEAGRPLRPAG